VDAEVIDPRTLVPLDRRTIAESVMKTHRAVIVTEDCKTGGVSAELMAVVMEEAFDYLDAPVKRVAGADTPIPFSPPLEKFVIPDEDRIIKAVKEILGR